MRAIQTGTPCPGNGASFAVVSDMAGLAALGEEWRALFARAAAPQQVFQSFPFLWHWAQHYLAPGIQLCVVVCRQDGRLVMVLPLVRQRRYGVDILRFMGLPVAQFGDVLIEPGADPALRRSAWTFVEGLGADLLEASKVRSDAAFAGLHGGNAILYDAQEAPFSDLARRACPDGPGPAYSARERSNYRRRLRRMAERGETRTRAEPAGQAAALLAGRAIAMKRDWLRRNAVFSPSVLDLRFDAFFRDVAADSEAALFATVLERNGHAIGIDLSFDCGGHTFGHVITTEPAEEKEGVGGILVQAVLAAAKARGSTVFELMAPADTYKMQHADGTVAVESLSFPFTRRGRLYCHAVLRHVLPTSRRLIRALPAWATRMLVSGARPRG